MHSVDVSAYADVVATVFERETPFYDFNPCIQVMLLTRYTQLSFIDMVTTMIGKIKHENQFGYCLCNGVYHALILGLYYRHIYRFVGGLCPRRGQIGESK